MSFMSFMSSKLSHRIGYQVNDRFNDQSRAKLPLPSADLSPQPKQARWGGRQAAAASVWVAVWLGLSVALVPWVHADPVAQVAVASPDFCHLWEDEQQITHIHAGDEVSAVRCMGYLHGRDRLWQMDFFRSVVQGKKSELVGFSGLKSDFLFRLLGLTNKAEKIWQTMPPEGRTFLESYALGVNQGAKEALRKGVYEYQTLGGKPELWRPQDTLSLMLLQSFDQTKQSFQVQLDQVQAKVSVGRWGEAWKKKVTSLFQELDLPWGTPILKVGEYPGPASSPTLLPEKNALTAQEAAPPQHAGVATADVLEPGDPFFHGLFGDVLGSVGMGSNNWVIAPSRSHSGHAWLANDPHLRLGYPPFWYWSHVTGGKWDTMGASFPGVPFIISGANQKVSWGLTNSFLPVSRLGYVSEDELTEAVTERPVIWFRFGPLKLPFFFKTLRRTAKSSLPILPLDAPKGKAAVLRWSGYDLTAQEMMNVFKVMGARSAADADQLFSQVKVPSWNFVFADDHGSIGYRAIGRVPRFIPSSRKKTSKTHLGYDFGIASHTLAEMEEAEAFQQIWTKEEMPHLLNPKRGYVVTANNRQWARHASLVAGNAHLESFRAFRIEELIKQTPRHDLHSLQQIQCDTQEVDARFYLPPLIRILRNGHLTSTELAWVDALAVWDWEADLNCHSCGLFRLFMLELVNRLGLDMAGLYRLIVQEKNPEFRAEIVKIFRLSLGQLPPLDQVERLRWGAVHLESFAHWSGLAFPGLDPSPGVSIPVPGDDQTVNYSYSTWDGQHFVATDGPSHRLIVEMAQPPRIYAVLSGENKDQLPRQLRDPDSEWSRWSQCKLRRRVFPVAWKEILPQSQKLRFETVTRFP